MEALLHLLPSLVALIEEANVTRAARRLGVSQPRMSARLAQLRAEFADPLLVAASGRRGLVATDRGGMLAEEARELIRRMAELAAGDSFDPATANRTFNIMANDNAASLLGIPLAAAIRAKTGPRVRVALHQYVPSRSAELESGRLDLALGSAASFTAMPDLISRVIVRDRFVSAVRLGDEIADGIDSFCARPHVLVSGDGGGFEGPVDQVLATIGRARDVVLSVQSYLVAIEAVVAGNLVATLPRALLERFADRLTLFDPPIDLPTFALSAAWHPRMDGAAAHRWLRNVMAEMSAKPTESS